MTANSDLPPAYATLQAPPTLNIDMKEEESKCDDGSELLMNDSFEDKSTRLIFIQKVLTIKLLQLLGMGVLMGIFATVFLNSDDWFRYRYDIHFIVTSLIAYLVTLILLICCEQARRQNPCRFIFLVVYPLSIAFFISSVTYYTGLTEIIVAWVYHVVAVFALLVFSIFTLQTNFDFVTRHGIYITIGVQVVMYALSVPCAYVNPFYVLLPTIILALEHAYILFAIHVMTSKRYKAIVTSDDYVNAALNLHIDYIYIFIKFLVPKICIAWEKFIYNEFYTILPRNQHE